MGFDLLDLLCCYFKHAKKHFNTHNFAYRTFAKPGAEWKKNVLREKTKAHFVPVLSGAFFVLSTAVKSTGIMMFVCSQINTVAWCIQTIEFR